MAPALNLPAPAHGTDNTLAWASAPSTSKFASTGGIIYPPPELRRTIDKAAELIAKKDPSFEANIKAAESNNPKFAFLKEDDAYHAYYASRRDAVRRGETLTPAAADDPNAANTAGTAGVSADGGDAAAGPSTQPPPEPAPFEFSADLPNITAVDLDILKLTALFTARKGRSFATSLLSREAKSYQFEFLRPSHSLFTYFNHLVEQYQNVISPTPALLESVKLGAYGTTDEASIAQLRSKSTLGAGKGGARPHVLEQVKARADWERYTREKRKKQDEDQEKQRHAFNEIDWQDFVVVGTVELTEADQHIDLPAPRSLREMESMTLAEKKMASMIMESDAAADDVEEVEELVMPGRPSGSAVTVQEASASAPSAAATVEEVASGKGGTIKVRKDYVPRGLASRTKPPSSSSTAMTKCPVCGDQVPMDEMAEHVRFELLNPAYREQRQQLEAKKAQQAALQAGADPTFYLKQLASSRADEDEEARLKREAEERRLAKEKEKITWDGHAKSRQATREMLAKNVGLEQEMTRLSGKPVMAMPEFGPQFPGMDGSLPDDDAADNEGDDKPIQLPKGSSLPAKPVTGSPPPQSSPAPFGAGMKRPASTELSPPPPPPAPQPSTSSSTLAKKSDGTLHPEKTWLEAHARPTVTLTLTLPAIDDTSADAREEPYEAALKSTIATLRDYVHQDLLNSAIAASKIKVKVNGKPATLKQTLAYWNLTDGDRVAIDITK